MTILSKDLATYWCYTKMLSMKLKKLLFVNLLSNFFFDHSISKINNWLCTTL